MGEIGDIRPLVGVRRDLTSIEQVFDAWFMPASPTHSTDVEFFAGYERGRQTCLTKGPESARGWLEAEISRLATLASSSDGKARFEGYAQAVWDYEDANGLPHSIRAGIWL